MDDLNEFSDVDEVHIVLGPKSDIKLKINNNEYFEDNPRARTRVRRSTSTQRMASH
jgi:hypothetical protein